MLKPIRVLLPWLKKPPDASLVAIEDFRTATAGGTLVHTVLCLLIARKTRTLDRRFRGREPSTKRNAADLSFAWLTAMRALRQFLVGDSLEYLEFPGALFTVARGWHVFV